MTEASSRAGYSLDKDAIADMVKNKQRGFIDAYSGAEGICEALGSNSTAGLDTTGDAIERLTKTYGKNYVDQPDLPTYWELILTGCEDNTIRALIFCALVSFLMLPAAKSSELGHAWIEGFAIFVTVAVVLNLQAAIEYTKSHEFRRQLLELESDALVTVVRDGVISKITPKELVVGDVLRIQVGDVIPVDGVLLESTDVKMDESSMTGEPLLVGKDTAKDLFILSGTSVMTGSGKLLSVAVGLNSMQGQISVHIVKKEDEDDGGNLTEKLDTLALDIGKAGLIVSVFIFFLMAVIFFSVKDNRDQSGLSIFSKMMSNLLVAVTILVVAVPEGLPLAVALSLAITMGKMMTDKNRVKHMDACETMGSATTICSDKTGTLTQNKMTVMRVFAADLELQHDDATGVDLSQQLKQSDTVSALFLELVTQCAALNSAPTTKASLEQDGQWKYEGNATECALLKLAILLGADPVFMRASPDFQDPTGACKLDWGVKSFPFSSERKKMSWVVPLKTGGFRLFTKGAPTYVYDRCADALLADGSTKVPLDTAKCAAVVETFQRAAMRTLALAYRDFSQVPDGGWDLQEEGQAEDSASAVMAAECDVTLICIVGIEDPLRPTVTRAIEQCNQAGVDVRMCTGDALSTAVAISTQCGILRPMDLVPGGDGELEPKPMFAMTGAEFDERVHFLDESAPKVMRRAYDLESGKVGEMLAFPFKKVKGEKVINQAAFDLIWPKLRTLARCQPDDKLALVKGMRKSKVFENHAYCDELLEQHGIRIFPDSQVVAVTGDGTNDAPALKAANVGFAMGIVGTDIAKQACDIILLDDNFASTVAAVKWGRNVYDSISKFVQFQLTVNISAILIACIGSLVYSASPLGAVQMLWVNVIMDSLASVALASEPPTDALLKRQPYGKKRPMVTRVMWFNMLTQAAYQIAVVCFLLFDNSLITDGFGVGKGVRDRYCASHEFEEERRCRRTMFMRIVRPLGDMTLDQEKEQIHAIELGARHFTIVFNTFVFMQLFNEFNSRKLQTPHRLRTTWSEWNIFEGVTRNPYFVWVMVFTYVLQVLLVQFTGTFFTVFPLNPTQWLYCVLLGAGSWPVQWIANSLIVLDSYVYPVAQEVTLLSTASAVKVRLDQPAKQRDNDKRDSDATTEMTAIMPKAG